MSYKFGIIGCRGYPSTYGGFETFVRRLAPYLVSRSHSVTVYSRDGRAAPAVREGVRCVSTVGINTNALSTLSYGATATRHARKERYDAALVLNVANGYFLSSLSSAGIPTVVNPDGLEWERGKWNGLGKRVFRRGATLTAQHANEIVVDSAEIGRIWRADFGRDSTFIPYGADVLVSVPTDKLKEVGLDPRSYVLVVARLVPENNVDLFLDALKAWKYGNVSIVVVGSANKPNDLGRRLSALAAGDDRFKWLGHVSDQALLHQLWAHAAAYFHGHSVGGTNPALLQALGCGSPTIALDTPYNAEVVRDKSMLVSANADALRTALDTLTADSCEQDRRARYGQQIIAERYSWSAVLSAYERALINVAKSRRVNRHILAPGRTHEVAG